MMTPHAKRWISGIIAVPPLFAIIFFGSEAVFAALITIVVVGAVFEYSRMVFDRGFARERLQGLVIAVLICFAAFSGDLRIVLAVIAFSILVVFPLSLVGMSELSPGLASVAKVVFGFIYIPFMLSHFILLRHSVQGVVWIFFVLVLAFCGDITAFYVGRTIGKRKLMPLVSPGKTVEGTVGLLIGSMAGCLIYRYFFLPQLSPVHAAVLGFSGGIIGQLGDLCESVIKRASGVKDSGSLVLGHGGLLDRLDCLIFLAPYVYYYRMFLTEL
ncbi:MAG TPA: phosphatidate cytidylyltransferase [Syntrophales bacterium]|nr:phosphatidate cytidylyltransferase [Syntrophales bacterium]